MIYLKNKWVNFFLLVIVALLFSNVLSNFDERIFSSINPLFGIRTAFIALLVFIWFFLDDRPVYLLVKKFFKK